MKVIMWNCNVDESTKGRYDMILDINILVALGLKLKFSDHLVETYYAPLKGYTPLVVDLGMY